VVQCSKVSKGQTASNFTVNFNKFSNPDEESSTLLSNAGTFSCKTVQTPKKDDNLKVMKISKANALIKNWMQCLLNRFIHLIHAAGVRY
jgi:hypothetical protein